MTSRVRNRDNLAGRSEFEGWFDQVCEAKFAPKGDFRFKSKILVQIGYPMCDRGRFWCCYLNNETECSHNKFIYAGIYNLKAKTKRKGWLQAKRNKLQIANH